MTDTQGQGGGGDLIPLLACADIAAEHDYLIEVLGFTSAGIERTPAGEAVHAEVQLGDRRIWLHRTQAERGLVPPAQVGSAGGGMVVHVPDVDDHYRRAVAAGAEILYGPSDQDYGQREYGVRDPEGHQWWIATPIRPPSAR